MPRHLFEVIVKAEIELQTTVEADSEAIAKETAVLELRQAGSISNVDFDRCLMVDEEVDLELLRLADNHSRLPNG